MKGLERLIKLYNREVGEWEPAPAVVTTERMVAVGQVVRGDYKLYWVACNPSATLSVWEVTDAIAAGAAVRLDGYSTAREAKVFVFSPPCYFRNGIYLETFINMTSMTFGYAWR